MSSWMGEEVIADRGLRIAERWQPRCHRWMNETLWKERYDALLIAHEKLSSRLGLVEGNVIALKSNQEALLATQRHLPDRVARLERQIDSLLEKLIPAQPRSDHRTSPSAKDHPDAG